MYVKSNLGQQVPAATGAAYAMKLLAAGDPSQVPARTAGAWGHRRLEHRTGPIIMPHDTAPTVRPHAVGLSAHSHDKIVFTYSARLCTGLENGP